MKIIDAHYLVTCTKVSDFPLHDQGEIILLGRSNVGKSSFINFFCNRKKLAYFSSRPGKTQTLNLFKINEQLIFVDAPGYGYAQVSKKHREEFGQMIEQYLLHSEKLKAACLLIDFKVGPTNDDLLMYEYLKYLNIPTIIIATKKDKIKKNDIKKQILKIEKQLNIRSTDIFYPYSNTVQSHREQIHEFFETFLKATNE